MREKKDRNNTNTVFFFIYNIQIIHSFVLHRLLYYIVIDALYILVCLTTVFI
jgi:hypothetical protein